MAAIGQHFFGVGLGLRGGQRQQLLRVLQVHEHARNRGRFLDRSPHCIQVQVKQQNQTRQKTTNQHKQHQQQHNHTNTQQHKKQNKKKKQNKHHKKGLDG